MKHLIFIYVLFFSSCAGNKTYLSMQETFAVRLETSEKIELVEKQISTKIEKNKINPAAEQLLTKAKVSLGEGNYSEALGFAMAAEKKINEPFDISKIIEIAKIQKIKKSEIKKSVATNAATTYKYYKVSNWKKSKDCLWNISKRFYGTGFKWRLIYFANMEQIKNPNMIKKGMMLKIPGQWKNI